jgi:hypothetical protein
MRAPARTREAPGRGAVSSLSRTGRPPASPTALLRRAHADPASLSPAEYAVLQRTVGNRAVGALLRGSARGAPRPDALARYPYINSDPPERQDAIIYGIYQQNRLGKLTLVYVGQTTDTRIGTRFVEHVDNDVGAPWYGMAITSNERNWAYVPRTFESLKNVTKFETTAAEQWWYEKYLKAGANLLNANTPMRKATFNSYKTISGNYDAANIGVADSWAPGW